jgi:hypothetical protein
MTSVLAASLTMRSWTMALISASADSMIDPEGAHWERKVADSIPVGKLVVTW